MQSRLNERHTKPVPPAKRRSKRAKAKSAVYSRVKDRIWQLYPHFNVGISTGTPGGLTDRWSHPYRHWLFQPNAAYEDPEKTKKAGKK